MSYDFLLEYPNDLQIIFDKLNKNSIKPIIVGGYVRDKLLGLSSKDIDVELYGVENFTQLETILSEFGSVNNVGKSFGVCKLSLKNADIDIDFTQPRIDNKIAPGHSGFSVKIDKNLDFKRASSRRDFTINAIGYDTIEKKILDPYDGRKDLKKQLLKAVNIQTFSEDPLRVLRAIGFASRFNFRIDDTLFSLCEEMIEAKNLDELAKERIYEEFKKILIKSHKISHAFLLFKGMKLLDLFHPLEMLDSASFTQLLSALDNITNIITNYNKESFPILLAVVCHQFTIKQAEIFIQNLTNDNRLLEETLSLLSVSLQESYTDTMLYQLATQVNIEKFLLFNRCIGTSYSEKFFDELKSRARDLNILNKKAEPLIKGRDIQKYGIKPSEEYSKILQDAYEAQISLVFSDKKGADEWLKHYLLT